MLTTCIEDEHGSIAMPNQYRCVYMNDICIFITQSIVTSLIPASIPKPRLVENGMWSIFHETMLMCPLQKSLYLDPYQLQTDQTLEWKICLWCRGCRAFKDVCLGLYMLHTKSIAHLDLTTMNLLLSEDGICKISDLGLGKLLATGVVDVTAGGRAPEPWMSPEQLSSSRCTLQSDIWSLSTILWEVSNIVLLNTAEPSVHHWNYVLRLCSRSLQSGDWSLLALLTILWEIRIALSVETAE